MLNEKQMHYLLTIAEEANITAAARRLYISQPALSRMLLDLEKELGAPLFVRDRGILHLTQTGEVYLRGCREILRINQSVAREISDRNGSRGGKILLGVTSLMGEYLLPRILNDFEMAYPHVELELVEGRASELPELVASGKVDIVLVYETNHPDLNYLVLRQDPIHIQVPPFFATNRPDLRPGVENPPLKLQELSGQPFVMLRKGRGMHQIAEQFFQKYSVTPGRVTETDNIHIANILVRLNRGFTLMPDVAAHRFFYNDDGSVYCPVAGTILERTVYACTRRGEYRTKAERFLLQLISAAPLAKDEK